MICGFGSHLSSLVAESGPVQVRSSIVTNGSMSSNQPGEADIYRAPIEAVLLDYMDAFHDRRQQNLVNRAKPTFTNFSNNWTR